MPQVKVNSPAFSFVSGQIARKAKDLIAARGGLVAIKVQPDRPALADDDEIGRIAAFQGDLDLLHAAFTDGGSHPAALPKKYQSTKVIAAMPAITTKISVLSIISIGLVDGNYRNPRALAGDDEHGDEVHEHGRGQGGGNPEFAPPAPGIPHARHRAYIATISDCTRSTPLWLCRRNRNVKPSIPQSRVILSPRRL
jgi:hypothetical protein